MILVKEKEQDREVRSFFIVVSFLIFSSDFITVITVTVITVSKNEFENRLF